MKKLIVLAIVLRLLVATFYFHPDIKTYSFQTSFFRKGVVDIYSYLTENKKDLPLKDGFVYFPLTYLTLGSYQAIISPLLPNLDSWLSNADSISMVRDTGVFKYLFFLKFPYLVFDIAIAFILMRFFENQDDKRRVFVLWLFNPFTIILIYAFGNVDIMPVALTALSFLFINKNKPIWASLLLGIAAGFKLYPLLFIPFLFLSVRGAKQKIFVLSLPLLILGLVSFPFFSSAFVESALVSGLTTRIFNPSFSIGFNESAIVSLLAVSMLFFWAYLKDKKINLFNYWIAAFGLIFAFSHFHIAWLLWLAPFIVILVVKNPRLSWPIFFLGVIAFAIPALYEDRSMSIGLLRVYSTLYDLIPTPFAILEKVYDPYGLQSILHSILAGGSMVVVYSLFDKKELS